MSWLVIGLSQFIIGRIFFDIVVQCWDWSDIVICVTCSNFIIPKSLALPLFDCQLISLFIVVCIAEVFLLWPVLIKQTVWTWKTSVTFGFKSFSFRWQHASVVSASFTCYYLWFHRYHLSLAFNWLIWMPTCFIVAIWTSRVTSWHWPWFCRMSLLVHVVFILHYREWVGINYIFVWFFHQVWQLIS